MDTSMTSSNHLIQAGLLTPYSMDRVVTNLFAGRNAWNASPAFISTAYKLGAEKIIPGKDFEWKVNGAKEKPLVVMEDSTAYGGYGTQVILVVDNSLWKAGDTVTPGDADLKYQVQIRENPTRKGNYFVYSGVTKSGDAIPSEFFTVGTPWAKLFSEGGEAEFQRGSTTFSLPLTFKNKIGKITKEFEITDYAATFRLAYDLVGADGKTTRWWSTYQEAKAMAEFAVERNRALWVNRSNQANNKNASGYVIDSFPGLYEQLEQSNRLFSPVFSAALLEEYLMDMYFSTTAPGQVKELSVFTGRMGMRMFDTAMTRLIAANHFEMVNADFSPIRPSASEYHRNNFEYGFSILRYVSKDGVRVSVIHEPFRDDTSINLEKDPLTGKPKSSARMTILDFSPIDGENNICIVKNKDGFGYAMALGTVSPNGRVNGLTSNLKDSYKVALTDMIGVQLQDPTRCGEIIIG